MKNINIYKENKIKTLLHKVASKIEDVCLSLLLRLPDKCVPMNLVERYISKRQSELQHEIIKGRWNVVDLEDVVKEIKR